MESHSIANIHILECAKSNFGNKIIEKYKINTMIKVKKLAYDVYKTSDDFLILCNILLYMYDDCIHYKVKNEINYMNR